MILNKGEATMAPDPKTMSGEFGGTPATDKEGPSSALGKVAESAQDVSKNVADFAAGTIRDVRNVAEDKADKVVDWIKARPVESVLIGVATGFLLGWLTGQATWRR